MKLRRLSQAAFSLLFFYLFLDTVYHPVNRAGPHTKLFFELNPLVHLSTWLAGGGVASGVWLAVGLAAITVLAGRWFCGWVCPFGALNNLFTAMRGGPVKARIASGEYSRWQTGKYYVLIVSLSAAIAGLNLAGLLDPFSLFFRSTAITIFPVFNDSVTAVFTWLYDRSFLTSISEPVYDVLRRNVLAVTQPHYQGGMLIGFLLAAIIGLNFVRARFWCRYICPLGALLGVLGKNPLLRLERTGACNNCGLCVASCQGGANPDTRDGWKPSECFYCWNCREACPKHALSFQLVELKVKEPVQ